MPHLNAAIPLPNSEYVSGMPRPCTIHSPSVGPMILPSAYLQMHSMTRCIQDVARKVAAHAVLNMEYTASSDTLTPPLAAPIRSTSAASCRVGCDGWDVGGEWHLRQGARDCKRAGNTHEAQGSANACEGGRQHQQRHRHAEHDEAQAHDLTCVMQNAMQMVRPQPHDMRQKSPEYAPAYRSASHWQALRSRKP